MSKFTFSSWQFRLFLLVVLATLAVIALRLQSHLLVVVSLAVLATGWAASDFLMVRRLRALVDATKRVATGDTDARTGLAGQSGELGQLAGAIDHLAATMQSQQLDADQATLYSKEREEQFHLLVQGVKDFAIFMLDARGRVVSWNAGAE